MPKPALYLLDVSLMNNLHEVLGSIALSWMFRGSKGKSVRKICKNSTLYGFSKLVSHFVFSQ